MTELTDIYSFISSLHPEAINAWAGLAAVLVAGLAVWVVHMAHKREDR